RDYNLIDWSDCSGTVVVFIPEWWSLSLRNGGRFQPGMVVVFGRNTQSSLAKRGMGEIYHRGEMSQ
ncbi:MAG: hypothetical protein V1782_09850, partial [Pseudomonadota bacterium]